MKSRYLLLLLFLVAGAIVLSGCESPATGATGGGTSGNQVIADVDGVTITLAEAEEAAGNRLKQVEHDRFEVIRRSAERLIEEKVVEAEAARRGITVEELYAAEVQSKIDEPTEEQLRGFFQLNKARADAMGKTFEDVRGEIAQGMKGQQVLQLTHEFVDGLREQAVVDISLAPPRFDVAVGPDELSRGPLDAPLTVVEYADFECGYCKQSHGTLEQLITEYGDRIRFVYRDFPLSGHRRAAPSSEAARCAGDQGRYWEYHEELMIGMGDLSDDDLRARARKLELDMDQFEKCYSSRRYASTVQQGLKSGRELGVTGTPAFFVNGRFISGAMNYEGWKQLLDAELASLESGN